MIGYRGKQYVAVLMTLCMLVVVVAGIYLITDYGANSDEVVSAWESIQSDYTTDNTKSNFYQQYYNNVIIDGASIATNSVSGNFDYDVEVFNTLTANGYTKAYAMAVVYEAMKNDYEANFIYGLLGNIQAEGTFGQIEGIWSSKSQNSKSQLAKHECQYAQSSGNWIYKYWVATGVTEAVHEINYKNIIDNPSYVDILLTIPDGVEGIGVGSIQWSGSRRVKYLNMIKEMAPDCSLEGVIAVEMYMIKDELETDYAGVVSACKGLSASECAKLIHDLYEKSGVANAASTRAGYANTIANILGSIGK